MTAETATLIAGGLAIVGALLGAVVGLVVEDRLRRRGEVRLEVRAWSGGRDWTAPQQNITTEQRVFEVRFFNDKDVNVSLWDVKVEFYRDEQLIESMTPIPITPIDLESRKSVFMALELEAGGELLDLLKTAERSTFAAKVVPGERRVSIPLRSWDPLEPIARW